VTVTNISFLRCVACTINIHMIIMSDAACTVNVL